MKFYSNALMFALMCGLVVGVALADQPLPVSAVQELDFSPPPVPAFMLRKPDKPLTLEEMKAQADEVSRRVREQKEVSQRDQTDKK